MLKYPAAMDKTSMLFAAISLAVQLAASSVPTGMVRLPGGTFTMGTDAAKIDDLMARFATKRREFFAAELPAHDVTLRPFAIDRTEVTNADFKKWMPKAYAPGDADLPVTFVTWTQASAYCASVGKRLPSEAEWEFAAGGGRAAEYPWGDAVPEASTANWQGGRYREADARWALSAKRRRPLRHVRECVGVRRGRLEKRLHAGLSGLSRSKSDPRRKFRRVAHQPARAIPR